MAEKFIVGCYGLVFDGGNLLMVKQRSGHWAGKWILPGGKLEIGESFEQCIEREVFEETFCRVKAVRQLSAVASYSPDSAFEKQVVLVFYLCKLLEGEPKKGDGVDAASWVDVSRFEHMAGADMVPARIFNVVSDLCAKKSFPAVTFDFCEAASMAGR
ncbi:NUDIX hydrolase [Methanocella paludicola SANAE]|uniref:NUDIX hydrolase n=1 Tax=Methanocella paludicola (strain DSM 17711 / JCM 13418 / NBRC 101707 / SANAE) TaxID=304371 RepID=D1Z1G5_METPS|nr:NUDIX domain-containing protein [Methanocella paludicola]BAI62537.1 NUDIX hydrolase [Methanocella paludicola SANAE]